MIVNNTLAETNLIQVEIFPAIIIITTMKNNPVPQNSLHMRFYAYHTNGVDQ